MSSSTKSPYATFITHFISLISLSLIKWPDQRSACGGKNAVTPNLRGTEELMSHKQRLRHLISEKGRGLSSGACDVTECATRMARVTAKFGLCGREWNGRPRQNSLQESLSLLVFSLDTELKRELKFHRNYPFFKQFSQMIENSDSEKLQYVLNMSLNILTALLITH